LNMIRTDLKLQVTSALAALVGRISYGAVDNADSRETAKDRIGHGATHLSHNSSVRVDVKNSRKALWEPESMKAAQSDVNNICNRYGVEILSINLISAAPSDSKLVDIMSRGAIATVAADELVKGAKAEANAALIQARTEPARAQADADAMLIRVRSQADAVKIAAVGEADAERIRGNASKDAGKLLEQSEVAVQLAKLEIAYGPFSQNQSSSFFFGLNGPSDLPGALMGKHLAAQAGVLDESV